MKILIYESPAMEIMELHLDQCILEGSVVTTEDYDQTEWEW